MVCLFQSCSNTEQFNYDRVFIPFKLNLDKLITEYHPTEITIHKNNPYLIKEKAAWIVGQIIASQWSQKKKGLRFEDGWAPLYSPLLKTVVHNYRQYIDYLLRVMVIECDDTYSNHPSKMVSKKYRITNQYHSRKVKSYTLFNTVLLGAIIKNRVPKEVEDRYSYLTKWYDYLSCDMSIIHEVLKKLYPDDSAQIKLYLNSIHRCINQGKGSFSIGVSNRLTTPICNIPKECRAALRYSSERLVELDIKNSIPMMSLVLLDNKVLKYNPNLIELIETSTNHIISNIEYKEDEGGSNGSSYMLVDIGQLDDVLSYKSQVIDGTIYEYLADHWNNTLLNIHYDRNTAKKKLLTILNSPSKFQSKERTELINLFPNVMGRFDWINEGYNNTKRTIGNREWDSDVDGKKCPFAIVTQKIESWFVLNKICGRVSKELPTAPIYTIHDAIYTTESYIDRVQQIIMNEFVAVFGISGKVKIKRYT